MQPFVVLFKLSSRLPADPPLALYGHFLTQYSTEEQAKNILGKEAEILWVWNGESVQEALADYYG